MGETPEFVVYGDWRDLRRAIERAAPEWTTADEETREMLWNFAEAVIAEYPRLKAKCLHCDTIIAARAAYRCTECKVHLCENCIHAHFGKDRWRHS